MDVLLTVVVVLALIGAGYMIWDAWEKDSPDEYLSGRGGAGPRGEEGNGENGHGDR